MGLGYDDLSRENPGLIYCSISGYGRTGPYAEHPGYDAIIQAEGGMMSITGPKEGPPSRVGIPIIDITSGMYASSAILAALHERTLSGKGQLIDISLLDTQAALLANVASNYLVGGEPPQRVGNAHPNIAPYEPVQARNKGFLIGAANQRQWERLCDLIGNPALKEDPRFLKNVDRVENRDALIAALNEIFQEKDATEWLEIIQRGGLPCGPINTVPEVFQHPQSQERGFVQQVEHTTAGQIPLTGFPYKLSRTPAEVHHPPPTLGEHNREILMDLLGYTADQVDKFENQGVI
jgi:crotonobetainyl-CoA:carnitine CoA-transferase CaiB-like acyl-CoA transferase